VASFERGSNLRARVPLRPALNSCALISIVPRPSLGLESMTDPSAFCEVVSGTRPQEFVHADEHVLAFLCEPPAAPFPGCAPRSVPIELQWILGLEPSPPRSSRLLSGGPLARG
jgi:hypothetical protein